MGTNMAKTKYDRDLEPQPEEVELYEKDPKAGQALFNKNRGIVPEDKE